MPIPAGLTVPQLMWLLLLGQLYGSYHHVAPPHAAVAPSPHACRWAVGLVLAALMGTATPARMSASAPRRETSTTLQGRETPFGGQIQGLGQAVVLLLQLLKFVMLLLLRAHQQWLLQ